MRAWTMEVLKELKKENWASLFVFHNVSWEEMYNAHLFDTAVWYRPDKERPVFMLGE